MENKILMTLNIIAALFVLMSVAPAMADDVRAARPTAGADGFGVQRFTNMAPPALGDEVQAPAASSVTPKAVVTIIPDPADALSRIAPAAGEAEKAPVQK